MGYRIQFKREEITLDGEFEGLTFTAIVNPPLKVIETIASGDTAALRQGLSQVVVGWNVESEEGNPLDPTDPDAWALLPADLIVAIGNAYVERVSQLTPLQNRP